MLCTESRCPLRLEEPLAEFQELFIFAGSVAKGVLCLGVSFGLLLKAHGCPLKGKGFDSC